MSCHDSDHIAPVMGATAHIPLAQPVGTQFHGSRFAYDAANGGEEAMTPSKKARLLKSERDALAREAREAFTAKRIDGAGFRVLMVAAGATRPQGKDDQQPLDSPRTVFALRERLAGGPARCDKCGAILPVDSESGQLQPCNNPSAPAHQASLHTPPRLTDKQARAAAKPIPHYASEAAARRKASEQAALPGWRAAEATRQRLQATPGGGSTADWLAAKAEFERTTPVESILVVRGEYSDGIGTSYPVRETRYYVLPATRLRDLIDGAGGRGAQHYTQVYDTAHPNAPPSPVPTRDELDAPYEQTITTVAQTAAELAADADVLAPPASPDLEQPVDPRHTGADLGLRADQAHELEELIARFQAGETTNSDAVPAEIPAKVHAALDQAAAAVRDWEAAGKPPTGTFAGLHFTDLTNPASVATSAATVARGRGAVPQESPRRPSGATLRGGDRNAVAGDTPVDQDGGPDAITRDAAQGQRDRRTLHNLRPGEETTPAQRAARARENARDLANVQIRRDIAETSGDVSRVAALEVEERGLRNGLLPDPGSTKPADVVQRFAAQATQEIAARVRAGTPAPSMSAPNQDAINAQTAARRAERAAKAAAKGDPGT